MADAGNLRIAFSLRGINGLIAVSVISGRRRRVYKLTEAGVRALSGKRADWRNFAATISAALEGGPCPDPA